MTLLKNTILITLLLLFSFKLSKCKGTGFLRESAIVSEETPIEEVSSPDTQVNDAEEEYREQVAITEATWHEGEYREQVTIIEAPWYEGEAVIENMNYECFEGENTVTETTETGPVENVETVIRDEQEQEDVGEEESREETTTTTTVEVDYTEGEYREQVAITEATWYEGEYREQVAITEATWYEGEYREQVTIIEAPWYEGEAVIENMNYECFEGENTVTETTETVIRDEQEQEDVGEEEGREETTTEEAYYEEETPLECPQYIEETEVDGYWMTFHPCCVRSNARCNNTYEPVCIEKVTCEGDHCRWHYETVVNVCNACRGHEDWHYSRGKCPWEESDKIW